MKEYNDLELSLLSCIVLKPELIEKLDIEDKCFINHIRLVKFMRAFYEKYECFDLALMYTVCKDKFQIVSYIEMLCEKEGTWRNFEKYKNRLKELYDQRQIEASMKEEIFGLANKLICGLITLDDFKNKVDTICKGIKKV